MFTFCSKQKATLTLNALNFAVLQSYFIRSLSITIQYSISQTLQTHKTQMGQQGADVNP